jgi:GH25 family lysozyme M1 (1,4-beta-N-acetylmuramidase)
MLHIQSPPPDWPQSLTRLPTGSWNKFFSPHLCAEAHALRPDCFTTFRHHIDHQDAYLNAPDRHNAARAYIATWFNADFLERAHAIAGVEGLNETYSPENQGRPAAFDFAFAQIWNDEYRTRYPECQHIRPILGNIAVGNDAPVSVARACIEFDGIMAYHAYWPTLDSDVQHNQIDYALRWQRLDTQYTDAGYHVDWLFTETGAIGFTNPDATNDWSLDGRAGWKHSRVCAGDPAAHLDGWRWFINQCRAWNANNNNRALGANAFTSHVHDDGTWTYFLLDQPHLNELADTITACGGFQVTTTEPPEPPEPPKPETYLKLIRLLPQQSSWQLAQQTMAIANRPNNQNTISYSPHDTANILTLEDSADGSSVVLHGNHPNSAELVDWFNARFFEDAPDTDLRVRFFQDWKLPPHGLAGVDVSRWNDPEQFDAAAAKKAGCSFIYVRLSHGMTRDDSADAWLDLARREHFEIGAYHWISPNAPGDDQAIFFAQQCANAQLDYTPALDVERGPSGQPTAAAVELCAYTFESVIGTPMIYTGHGHWDLIMQGSNGNDSWAANFPLWLAAHTNADAPIIPDPWEHWVMWQHWVSKTNFYPQRIDQNITPTGTKLTPPIPF